MMPSLIRDVNGDNANCDQALNQRERYEAEQEIVGLISGQDCHTAG
jgi:hypothetical protein